MGIIVKSNNFSNQANPQLTWLDADFDALFALVNGELDNANIAANADISQGKIANLLADLGARLLLVGGRMTGRLDINMDTPYVRFIGTELGWKDFRVAENAGQIQVDENTGTEGTPVWTTRYTLPNGAVGPAAGTDLTTKTYVDARTDVVFGKVTKTNGNVDGTASFVDVPDLSITLVTKARRARITLYASITSPSNNVGNILAIRPTIDDAVIAGQMPYQSIDGRIVGACFSIVTDALTVGSHVFKIQIINIENQGALVASATYPCVLSVEELLT